MRIVFAGTPEVAVPTLEALVDAGHEVVAALTRPDAPVGRKRVMTPSPVAARAEALGIPVIRTNRPGDEETAEVAALAPDLGVVVAYGAILRLPMLNAPAHGWINLHFSLLPKWRGAAPVQRAVMAGERETGICVFQLEEGLDTGPVFANERVSIGAEETAGELLDRLANDGTATVLRAISGIERGATPEPQVGEPTYAHKLTREDAGIDWYRPQHAVHAHIRGVTPEPGAASMVGEQRVKVHAVRLPADELVSSIALEPGHIANVGDSVYVGTASTPLELVTVQPAGKTAMAAADWLRGHPNRDTLAFD